VLEYMAHFALVSCWAGALVDCLYDSLDVCGGDSLVFWLTVCVTV